MSDNVMAALRQARGPEMPAPSQQPGMEAAAETPPMASPMANPEPKMGSREGALINVGMAMDLIERSLPAIGSESEEGQKLMAALRTLTGVMGAKRQKAGELQQAEILQLLQSLPQAGGATPEMKAMAGMPQIPGMAGGQPPGGMPGGMPPQMPGAGGPPGMPR